MMKHFIFFLFVISLLAISNVSIAEPDFSPAYQELLVQQQRLSVLTQSNTLLQTQLLHLQQRLEEIKTKPISVDILSMILLFAAVEPTRCTPVVPTLEVP